MPKAVGIDLGTTNSVVSVLEAGDPLVIPNAEGSRTTPSVVAFSKAGEVLVGEVAKRQAITNPGRTIRSVKRHMGTDWKTEIDGKAYTAQEISARTLMKLKADAEAYLNDTVTQAVQERYEWEWDDAERTKVYVGLPGHAHLDPSQREGLAPRADGLDHAAQQVVAVAASRLADEIVTTLAYHHESAVGRVLLAGAGSRLGGFDEHLARRLGVPVERLDLGGRLRTPGRAGLDDTDPAALAVPAGLCLGASR